MLMVPPQKASQIPSRCVRHILLCRSSLSLSIRRSNQVSDFLVTASGTKDLPEDMTPASGSLWLSPVVPAIPVRACVAKTRLVMDTW